MQNCIWVGILEGKGDCGRLSGLSILSKINWGLPKNASFRQRLHKPICETTFPYIRNCKQKYQNLQKVQKPMNSANENPYSGNNEVVYSLADLPSFWLPDEFNCFIDRIFPPTSPISNCSFIQLQCGLTHINRNHRHRQCIDIQLCHLKSQNDTRLSFHNRCSFPTMMSLKLTFYTNPFFG